MIDSLNRAMMRAREEHDTSSIIASGDGLVSIALLKSPAFRCLSKSGHLALARVTIELANGRNTITHRMFQSYGIPRDSITAAVCEIEAVGIVRVQRRDGPCANAFDLSQKWRAITSLAEAKQLRDRARHFGITRRRKVERKTTRIVRGQRLARLRQMIGAQAKAPAFAALDDTAVAVFDVIADAIGRSRGIAGAAMSYERLCEQTGIGRNTLARSLRTLQALGFVSFRHGRRTKNIYRLAEAWREVRSVAAAERRLARRSAATQDDAR